MKRFIGGAAVMAAAILLATGGQAISAEKKVTDNIGAPGSWQYEGAIEAANLPKGEDLSIAKTGSSDDFAKAEAGGLVYRIGVDSF